MSSEQVILVNEDDTPVGTMEKLEAHRRGVRHRAFSVFVYTPEGRLSLQQRAISKYHCGGLWSNTCCGHPRPGETTVDGAVRRLEEEMGFRCGLSPLFTFTYRAELGNGLIEHEVDHVLMGIYSGEPSPDSREAQAWEIVSASSVEQALEEDPARFTPWFHLAFPRIQKHSARWT